MSDLHRTTDGEIDRIVQALETAPHVPMPDDFTARVMARVPRQRQRHYVLLQSLRETHVGRSLAFAALLTLVAGMCLLAPYTTGSEVWLLVQGVLFAQLTGLLLWMGISYKRLL